MDKLKRLIRNRLVVVALLTSGCMWGAFSKLLSSPPTDHNCACYPNGTTKKWYMCDSNGNKNPDGPFYCCAETLPSGSVCNKLCL